MPDEFGLPTTQLTLFPEVASGDELVRQRALEKLMECYLPGMRRYLAWRFRGSVLSPDDVVQDLITDKMLQGQLIHRYSECDRKGFRNYLKGALRNRAIDEIRRMRRAARFRNSTSNCQMTDPSELSITVEQLRFLFLSVFRRVRDHYIGRGRQRYWDGFFRLYIEPVITGTDKPPYEKIVHEVGFVNKDEAYDAMINVRRRFHLTWEKVLEEKLATTNPEIIEDEKREIARCASLFKSINMPDLLASLPVGKARDPMELATVSAAQLSDLFDFAINRGAEYTDAELRAFYRAYASGSLLSLFEQVHAEAPKQLRESGADYDPSVQSIDRLLQHSHPPVALLVDLKRVARKILRSKVASVPRQIALAWRFVAIGLALVHCGTQIEDVSKLSAEELRQGFERMLEYPWIDEESRLLFQQAAGHLSSVTKE